MYVQYVACINCNGNISAILKACCQVNELICMLVLMFTVNSNAAVMMTLLRANMGPATLNMPLAYLNGGLWVSVKNERIRVSTQHCSY